MATNRRALIVGAGIAGLSAAWWLDKAGWTCTIIERGPDIPERGYMLSLSGPCTKTVTQMNLRNDLDRVAYHMKENVVSNGSGRELLRLAYADVHGKGDSLAVCRNDLARTLVAALPDSTTILFSKTVDHFTDNGKTVTATLNSGALIETDLLIGADGIRSGIRDQLWKDIDCLEHLGYGYAAYDVDGTHKLPSDCVSFNSPGRMDVIYQLRDKRVASLHIWREEGSATQDRLKGFSNILEGTEQKSQLVSDVIDCARNAGCNPVVDRLTLVALPKWAEGRVLLLGDAAHCLTLMSGQGAGMAMLSAEVLGKELAETTDIAKALANHEAKLRPAIERLQDHSRKMAAMYLPKSKLIYHLRNLSLKLMPHSWIVNWFANSAKVELELLEK